MTVSTGAALEGVPKVAAVATWFGELGAGAADEELAVLL